MINFKHFWESNLSQFSSQYGIVSFNDLIGKRVKIHPNASAKHEDDAFMEWSVYVSKEGSWKRVAMVKSIELIDVKSVVNHTEVNKQQRNPSEESTAAKTVNVFITGIVKDVEFDSNKLKEKLSTSNWDSITYNPHKNSEYIYTDCLSNAEHDWWYKDERFWPISKSPEFTKKRKEASIEKSTVQFKPECYVSTKITSTQSTFNAEGCILIQHKKFNEREDYMWIKNKS